MDGLDRVQQRISDIIQKMYGPESGKRPSETDHAGLAESADVRAAGGSHESAGQDRERRSFDETLEQLINMEGARSGVSPEIIRAVIDVESGGDPDAVSRAGAVGLMQLMPGTARELGVNPEDPNQNVRGGVEYLNRLATEFQDLDLTLAAYNAGPGAVRRHGGIPPYAETQNYVERVRESLLDTDA